MNDLTVKMIIGGIDAFCAYAIVRILVYSIHTLIKERNKHEE